VGVGLVGTVGLGRLALGSAKPGNTPAIKEIKINRSSHPESAKHIDDAQAAGKPSVLTVDREGAAARRGESLKGTERAPAGSDRDEYPPAMFKEGGGGASVRNVSSGDNRGAGASIGNQCRGVPNGGQVKLTTCK